MSDTKVCKTCHTEKVLDDFSICLVKNGVIYYRSSCKLCRKPAVDAVNHQYYAQNSEVIKENTTRYYENNRGVRLERMKDYAPKWREKNRGKLREQAVIRERNNRKNPVYRLRANIGRSVREALTIQGQKKGWRSFFDYVDYSLDELKKHLEEQFEPWMTWENYGTYDAQIWDDQDLSTWTWNIDHIIPQSELLYTSMEDDNFIKCWSLSNLRPYSAKQNNIDGASRIRHRGQNVI